MSDTERHREDVRRRLAAATADILARDRGYRDQGSHGPGRSADTTRTSAIHLTENSTDKSSHGPSTATADEGMTDDRSIYDAALRLLAVRARSCDEMRTRLLRKDFATEQVDELIDRLLRERLLDDTDFATEWVRSRHEHSGKGRTALRHELRTKGVAAEVIEGALAEIDTDDERVQAMRLVEKKVARLDAVDLVDRDDRLRHRRRLVAMLARRGFPAPMSIEIVDEALDALAHSAPH